MDSLKDVWAAVLEILGRDLTPTAMKTWFVGCEPVEIADDRLVLRTTSEFKRDMIEKLYSEAITNAMQELFACKFHLLVLTEDEMEEFLQEKSPIGVPDNPIVDSLPEIVGYTFDSFIVGSSNKLAHAAAAAVAEKPGKLYNPLFIYGNSGLGKTHLLLAIGHAIAQNSPEAKIVYVKGDEFVNQLVESLRRGTTEEFRKKYRRADLFLVDDIQFIAGKERTQEEFFHTFNNIYEAGHQIVITSDRPPLEMNKLADRLRSRFEGGLIVDVQPPDLETRMVIVRTKANNLGMFLSDEVIEYVAENVTANIRQLEGVIKRLTAFKELSDENITIASVKRAINDVIRVGTYIPTPEVIIEESARYFGVTPDEIRGQRRTKNITMARQVSMYLIRNLTNMSLVDIGKQYEDRNHSTVLNSIRKVEDMLETDSEVASTVRDISSNINSHN